MMRAGFVLADCGRRLAFIVEPVAERSHLQGCWFLPRTCGTWDDRRDR
jgi:hypothetical protein